MAEVSTMSALDVLNDFGRSPFNERSYEAMAEVKTEAEDELEEDEEFLNAGGEIAPRTEVDDQATPPPSDFSRRDVDMEQTPPPPSLSRSYDDLEEDESFMEAQPESAAATEAQAIQAPIVGRVDDLDLEENDGFVAFQSSPPEEALYLKEQTQTSADDEEELPTLSQAFPAAYNQYATSRITYSHLDLGTRASTSRIFSGTAYNGKIVRFGRKKGNALVGETVSSSDKDPAALGKMALGLLETPIHILLDNLQESEKTKQAAQSTANDAAIAAALQEGPQPDTKVKGKGKAKHVDTWTDRYKPRSFTELLGDERTHRQAMSWLKEWDTCVFKNTNNAALARKKALKRARNENGVAKDDTNEDSLGRPQDKVLLLTGPPGLGKTTLAHVIATQAGYQVMEVNASDDRTAKTVHDKIKDSLETRALTSLGSLASSKPTCLVIDEIDGAGGGDAGFIKTLVRLIQEGSRISKVKGKGKHQTQPLLRPIICICNDLYAPALRPLRAIARIVRFHAPGNAHLIKRLRTICEHEGLKADHKSLTTLVEVAEGDMRSCLNTLQIVRAQSTVLDEKAIKSTALGLKDTATSVTAVWDKLFKIPAKKRQKGLDQTAEGKYVNYLVKDITTCGEYDKLAQTCFESYLNGKNPADGMAAVTRALDWLQFYDGLDRRLRTDRDYDIAPYIPYSFIPWNPLFAAVSNKTPEWPKVDYEMHLKRVAHQEIADSLRNSLPLHVKSLFAAPTIAAELAPSLLRIISPDLKPVNQQLIKGEDKAVLKRLITTMSDLGISYVPDRNEEGLVVFKLEPQLDVFIHYENKRAPDVPAARFNLRQLISKELEAETVRRVGGDSADLEEKKPSTKSIGNLMKAYKATPKEDGKSSKDGPAIDFFGRPIVQKVIDVDENEAPEVAPPKKKVKVLYKYHEGFSNAVRINVKVSELFRA